MRNYYSKDAIVPDAPLFVTVEDIMVLLDIKKTAAYETIAEIKAYQLRKNPDLILKGARVPTHMIPYQIGLSMEQIAYILAERDGTIIYPPILPTLFSKNMEQLDYIIDRP